MVRSLIVVSLGLCCLLLASAERPPYKSSGIYEEEAQLPAVASDPSVASDVVGVVPAQPVDERYRLPKTSVPIHYDLHLRTDIHRNERTFSGSVGIQLQVVETTDKLVLHNRGLVISSAKVSSLPNGVNGAPSLIGDAQYATDTTFEHITFTSPTILQPGTYLLEVVFEGRLATNDDGFYVSSYVADNGERRYLATTQFESTSARMAFPCYDEPGLKATFTVSITHARTYWAISNMVEKRKIDVDDTMHTTEFEKTPVMSSYLLAFVVSDFLFRVGDKQRVYVRPNAFSEASFALEAGIKILEVLDEHLGIPYNTYMPKLYQIAVPDFAAGAMENWGLVTYREQALLFNPAVSTYRGKTNVATTIAHEYAHQWFGNLVTPEWWEYIWLNEGFATLYEFYALHLAYPEQEYWELFNTQVIQYAMGPDGQASTRPMNWNAATPGEISALFDRVAYDKSGSVLNMMRHVLGEEHWKAGLKTYLTDRALNSAVDEQLYAGLQSAIEGKGVLPDGVTVGQIMRTWTNEAGYPVLTVRRSYDTGDIIISQERFYADRKVPNSNVWMIPYNYVNQSVADFNEFDDFQWLATKAARFETTVPANQWIVFNKQQVGYYRVNYDERNWELITNALIENWASIHRLNRAQLIDDAYWLARSGRLDMRVALRLMTYLREEREYAPWTAANVVLTNFNNRLRGTAEYHNFLIFVDALIENIYGLLTIDSVSPNDTLLHKYLVQTISTWACSLGYRDCLQRMGALLTAEATNTGSAVHPDIATVAYCYGMRSAGEKEFQYLYRKMMDSKNLAERTMLIDSLGCSNNKDFLKAFLTTALGSGTGVEINYRADERRRVVQAVYSGGRIGVDALIEFLMDPALVNEFVSMLSTSTLNSALSAIASRTNNVEEMNMLNALITSLGTRVNSQTATNLRNTAQANLDWVNGFDGLILSNFLNEFAAEIQNPTTATPETTTAGPVTTTTPSSAVTTTRPTSVTTTTMQTTTEEDDGAATIGLSIAALLVGNGLKQTRFHTTPSMPTYLVAFAITNDFASTRLSLKAPPSSINMELIAPPTVTDTAQAYSLDLGGVILRTVEQYFNQSYDLPKLDQLAVPDFYFAAMENWGLVIYEERYLLYDELTSINRDKENVIATVVHEFVHQFLGNLLTPHWWSDLYLSEGFATFYEYHLSSMVEPNIRFSEKFTVDALQPALLFDCDINVRPISYDVQQRADIERMFDIISYQKGGSILRMFHYALGELTFLKGVRRYISANKGRSVTPDDLFDSLQAAAREDAVLPLSLDVATVMRPWIFQSGYPVVTVTLQNGELTFMQEQFLYRTAATSDRTWWIPITYHVHLEEAVHSNQFWMPHGTSQVSLVQEDLGNGFILVNPQQTGYYRVNYDENLWMRLIDQLITDPTVVSPVSRGQLLDDCFKLYYSGLVGSNIIYSLLTYAGAEIDAIPWTVAFANDNLGVLHGALVVERTAFEAFSVRILFNLHIGLDPAFTQIVNDVNQRQVNIRKYDEVSIA
uniref:Aminopeptidase N n=1 Tax=Anopheles christyi TaxID=43041 RepID=A0A182K7R1_9DIPT